MITELTKTECEGLISRLADKTLSFGCMVSTTSDENFIICSRNDDRTFECMGADDGQLYGDIGFAIDDEIIGHPVRIGDVLEKIDEIEYAKIIDVILKPQVDGHITEESDFEKKNVWLAKKILELWRPCGFTKSLQQIMEESGFDSSCENPHCHNGNFPVPSGEDGSDVDWTACPDCRPDVNVAPEEQLKNEKARRLFVLLAEIFPEENKK